MLVTDKTDPDWEPIMKKAAAIVTNRGGRTCHAAIVSRELGVPAVVGTEHGTELLHDGQQVTVSCAEGETGVVYDGALPFTVERVVLHDLPRPSTKVMLNVGNPEEAFTLSFLPNDGVGLAREEFIISNAIKVHPLALLDYERLDDPALKADIDRLTVGYTNKAQFFVDRLAQGVAMIAAAFYPKDVIVRLSDFKSNEYADLLGGRRYEPSEENPMLGFRGAARYYDPRYRDGFALECQAMRKVRDEMGLTNVKLMIPFCRTVDEGRQVLAEMQRHGLQRGENGLEVYVMCEIPSNVILAEDFAEIFDGFSIGSNDLTQLVLGVDRDSAIVAHLFDERDPAVKAMIASVIRTAKAKGRKIGICGDPEMPEPDKHGTMKGDIFEYPRMGSGSMRAASCRFRRISRRVSSIRATMPTSGTIRCWPLMWRPGRCGDSSPGPNGCEVTGVVLTPDGRTMFINIQHPGETSRERSDPAPSNRSQYLAGWRPVRARRRSSFGNRTVA